MDNCFIIIISSWYLAGICNGFMDAIKYHNAYNHWGSFWSEGSWKRLYDGDYNLFERIFGASFDAWHVLKYTMISFYTLSLFLGLLIKVDLYPTLVLVLVCILSFIIGFKTTYK